MPCDPAGDAVPGDVRGVQAIKQGAAARVPVHCKHQQPGPGSTEATEHTAAADSWAPVLPHVGTGTEAGATS